MSEPIISVSGLRGIVGDSLTPELAIRFSLAFASDLSDGPVVLSRDGRTTGRMLADLIRGALCAAGRSVIDADVAATPTLGVLVRARRAAGGIQISASHNPPEYNGLKLFAPDGRVLTAEAGRVVLQKFQQGTPNWVPYQKIGRVEPCEDTTTDHLGLVTAVVDLERIRSFGYHVLLDANHGAGALLGRRLLEHLGCRVTVLGAEPTGLFAHPPEPTAENLVAVGKQVRAANAVVGFCQDPDADRLALIDASGTYIGEEFTLAICVDHVLRSRKGPVVTNCSTSRMTEDLAGRHGVPFFRSAVGEANVVDLMKARGAVFGGEGNGGPIDPQVGFVRDSFVGMALVLDAMSVQGESLSQLVARIPRYAIHKSKVELPRERIAAALEALAASEPDAACDRLDGLRLDWPGKWLLVRASNTEPIVRAISEAPTAAEAAELCERADRVLRSV
ncbi:MAG: phosphoglucosamine mutase [Planctomycetes bacterium]|nr:phosphoglucosamine mutase [Planctomycetota bacterium]